MLDKLKTLSGRAIIALFFLSYAIVYAASTYTTHFNLEKPADNDTNWGNGYRANLDVIDTQLYLNETAIDDHLNSNSNAHPAVAIETEPGTEICNASEDAQDYLDCLDAAVGAATENGVVTLTSDQTISGAKTFSATTTLSQADVTTLNVSGTTTLGTLNGVVKASTGVLSASAITNADLSGTAGISNANLATMAADTIKGNNTGGAAVPMNLTSTQVTAMLDAFVGDSGAGGTKGLVPAPAVGEATFYLRGDGVWANVAGVGSPLTTKGDIYTFDTDNNRLPVGTDGQVLSANSAQSTGLEWIDLPAGFADPMTTRGDIIYRNSSNATDRLALGAAGTFLRSDGTDLAYGAVDLTTDVSGVLPVANGGTNSSTALNNNRFIVSSSGSISEASAIASGLVVYTDANGLPTGESEFAYTAASNLLTLDSFLAKISGQFEDPDGGTNKVTVQASTSLAGDYSLTLPVDDGGSNECLKTDGSGVLSWGTCGSGSTSPLTTKGDIYVYSTLDDRLPVGTNGQVLSANSAQTTGLEWIDAPTAAPTIFGTAASPRAIVAGTGITSGASHMSTTAVNQVVFVEGSGGPVDISANPQISDHTITGATMRIVGENDVNTVEINNGNNVILNGAAVLGDNDVLTLMWDGSDWLEIGRSF